MRTHMRRGATLALSAVLLTGLAACDTGDLLEVTDPDIVTPDGLTTPSGLETLRAGAIGDFAFAYAGNGGGTEGQVLVSGLFTDEYIHSGTFTTRREFDRRDVRDDNGTATGVFGDLQRARQALENAASAIEANVEGADARVGELRGLAHRVGLGESCEGFDLFPVRRRFHRSVPLEVRGLSGLEGV